MKDSLFVDSLVQIKNTNELQNDESFLVSLLIIFLTGTLTYLLFTLRSK